MNALFGAKMRNLMLANISTYTISMVLCSIDQMQGIKLMLLKHVCFQR